MRAVTRDSPRRLLGASLLAGWLVETHPPPPPAPLLTSLKLLWPADPRSVVRPSPEGRTYASPEAMRAAGVAPLHPHPPRPCRGGPPGG